jgi:hypothetical protein
MLLLTGAIPTLTSISFIYGEEFSEEELELNLENDHEKNYQEMYKDYDFKKYLSHQYEVSKEYADYYRGLLYNVETSEHNPFIIDEDFKQEKDDNKKRAHYYSNTNNDDDDNDEDDGNDGRSSSSESDDDDEREDDISRDKKHSSSDKNEEKSYKNILVIECINHNINNYDIKDFRDIEPLLSKEQEDFSDIEPLLNEATTSENDNQEKSKRINNKGIQEYNIESDTKIIFICQNDNHNIDPNQGNNIIKSLPDEGIILPMNSYKDNNNNDDITNVP